MNLPITRQIWIMALGVIALQALFAVGAIVLFGP
jgi:hypothetical protein